MLVEKTVMVPKEVQECFDLINDFLKKLLVEKKSFPEVAANSLPAILSAIDGAQNIPDELKEKAAMLKASALFGADLGATLLKW